MKSNKNKEKKGIDQLLFDESSRNISSEASSLVVMQVMRRLRIVKPISLIRWTGQIYFLLSRWMGLLMCQVYRRNFSKILFKARSILFLNRKGRIKIVLSTKFWKTLRIKRTKRYFWTKLLINSLRKWESNWIEDNWISINLNARKML